MNWPTLAGRLNHPIVSELEALEQLEKTMQLSEYGRKRLKKLRKNKKPLDNSSKSDILHS